MADQESKKARFRDYLKNFCNEKYRLDFDKQHPAMQSKLMTEFYITEVNNKLYEEIPPDEFDDFLVDRANDLWVDFIYKNDDTWLIVQTKYRGVKSKSDEQDDVRKHKNLLNNLFENSQKAHLELRRILNEIDFKRDRFKLVFLTTGKFTDSLREIIDQEPLYCEGLEGVSERVDYKFYDEEGLNEELRSALSLSAGTSGESHRLYSIASEGSKRSNIIELTIGSRRQCVLAVNANQLVDAYQKNNVRDRLFSLNIRNYIGNLGFNKQIKATAENRSNDFFFFNNGISCLATSLTVDNKNGFVEVESLQVINGAQTLKTLVDSKKTASLGDITVLVRITEIEVGYGADGRFIEDITQFNNSQNTIKSSDFRSNDKIQIFLEDQFSKLKYDGKSVKYLRKRTDRQAQTKFTLIKMSDFTKVLHAFLIDPISFSSSDKYLYGIDKGDGYVKVYGDGVKLFETLPVDEFRYMAGVWWLGHEFQKKIKSDIATLKSECSSLGEDERKKVASLRLQALQGKWFLIYAARLLLERTYPDAGRAILIRYYDETWRFDDKAHGKWLQELYELSRSVVEEVYATAATGKGEFVHRNWLRSKEAMNAIETKCKHGARLTINASLPGNT